MGPAKTKDRTMPPISLSLIPVNPPKENSPIKTISFESTWKEDEYNALDKMKDFAEKAAFDLPKRKDKFDFSLLKSNDKKIKTEKENNLEKLIDTYSRIGEFMNGCDWAKLQAKKNDDVTALEQKYIDAKNEFMSQNLSLMPKESPKSVKEVIDLSDDDDAGDVPNKHIKSTLNLGKDGTLSISIHPPGKDIGVVRSYEL